MFQSLNPSEENVQRVLNTGLLIGLHAAINAARQQAEAWPSQAVYPVKTPDGLSHFDAAALGQHLSAILEAEAYTLIAATLSRMERGKMQEELALLLAVTLDLNPPDED